MKEKKVIIWKARDINRMQKMHVAQLPFGGLDVHVVKSSATVDVNVERV